MLLLASTLNGDPGVIWLVPWLTVKLEPPNAMLPLRAASGLTATVYATVPLPVPGLPLLMVIHGTEGVAVHVQVGAEAVTWTLKSPPVEGAVSLGGVKV